MPLDDYEMNIKEMVVRRLLNIGAWVVITLAVTAGGSAKAADTMQVKVCPTRDKAEQSMQSNGAVFPDACQMLTVTRIDSPTGAMCLVKLGDEQVGVLGRIIDGVTNSEWWTACGNIHAP